VRGASKGRPDDVAMPVHKIAVLAYHSSPLDEPGAGDAGGMTVYVKALARSLAERGVLTDIFTRAVSTTNQAATLSPGVRVVSIPAGPLARIAREQQVRFIDEFVTGVRAFAAAQRIQYELVHSHYWQSGLAGKALARAWGVPLVHSNHTLGRVKNKWLAPGDAPEPETRLWGEAEVMSEADVLVASTDEEWEHLACLYGAPHDRLKTLHPGVDHLLFAPGPRHDARAQLGLAPDDAVLLCVGRIQRLKGLELAIRAVEELVPAVGRQVRLLIVGGPSGRDGVAELERLRNLAVARGVADNVVFAGAQPHSRLPVFYRAADVVVVCSHTESFGLAALEAHACGIPVVATAVGGLKHIVRDGVSGFLVDRHDAAAFAGRLKTLLEDGALHTALSQAAFERSMMFSWDVAADAFLSLYECLVREQFPELCTC
jgi:D-inositol-3-phosphate glycosyltransferase